MCFATDISRSWKICNASAEKVEAAIACVGEKAQLRDVHRSLAYMQRQVEARGIADCDMYTFMRLSLLNLLVTDPSVASADPLARNPIVFASAGCADLAAISPR